MGNTCGDARRKYIQGTSRFLTSHASNADNLSLGAEMGQNC